MTRPDRTVRRQAGIEPLLGDAPRGRVPNGMTKLDVLAAEFGCLEEKGLRSASQMGHLVAALREEFCDLLRDREELGALYEVAQELAAASDLSGLLEAIISKAMLLVGAERGFVVLVEPSGEHRLAASQSFAGGDARQTDASFSSSLVGSVVKTGQPILTTNVQMDDRFDLSQSIITQDIRSVIAVALVARGETQGAIYVDTRMSVRPFSEDDLELLQAMASQAAMAVRGARLYAETLTMNEELQETLDELHLAQAQLVNAERLAAVGQLAASVAHELRNPLMVMRNSIYYLGRLVGQGNASPDIINLYLEKLDAEIDRQGSIINDLLFFSRNRPRRLTQVDLNPLLEEALLRVAMPESVQVQCTLDPDLQPIRADGEQLQQVMINLISNAVQAMPRGGTLKTRTRGEDQTVVIEIADTGAGILAENMARLFEPFFTTREKGIGLGLCVTKSIVEGHRGTIEVKSERGEGTTFWIRLPSQLIGA